jgi:hypothetical protein
LLNFGYFSIAQLFEYVDYAREVPFI